MKQNYLYEILELSESQKNELTAAFEKVLSVSGWINIEPFVEDDKRGETAGLFSWFSARGPQVPIGTLVFEGGEKLVSIGLSHGAGRNASAILSDEGIEAPSTWQLKQDHPKRGFVWEVNKTEVDTNSASTFLMEATYSLCLAAQERFWVVSVNHLN